MFYVRSLSAGIVALALVACGEAPAGDVLAPDAASLASTGPVLVECPVDYALATEGELDATGGSIRLQHHELAVPALALTIPTKFRLEAPASKYMELDLTANDLQSFQFKKSVSITIDYSRCTRSNIDKAALSVWQIHPVTKELLEYMGGVDDKANRTITFQTDHLSTFSIAE